jgi:transposase
MAVVVRMRTDPETRAYVERRTAEGRTTKEIRRSLKRYLARQIHHALTAATRVERTSCDMTRATPSLA